MDRRQFIKKINNKKILIWDFDGTIADLNIDWVGLKDELRSLVKTPDLQNGSLNDVIYELINMHQKKEKIFQIIRKYEKRCEFNINKEAVSFIEQYQGRYRMAIFSDNLKETIVDILKQCNLFKYFDVIVSKEDVNRFKPDVDGIYKIYKYMNEKDKKKYIMIGNSSKDKKVAYRFNINFIDVNSS